LAIVLSLKRVILSGGFKNFLRIAHQLKNTKRKLDKEKSDEGI
jgi:hypothetical protein